MKTDMSHLLFWKLRHHLLALNSLRSTVIPILFKCNPRNSNSAFLLLDWFSNSSRAETFLASESRLQKSNYISWIVAALDKETQLVTSIAPPSNCTRQAKRQKWLLPGKRQSTSDCWRDWWNWTDIPVSSNDLAYYIGKTYALSVPK